GKDKCEQAAGGQGGIPYPEDSSVIPLGGPSPSSAAPAPQTQATRPPPPAPRGTYSVISGGAMPAQAYNAIYSSVRSGRRVDEHTEVTAGNDGDATSANPNALENMMSDLQAWRGHRAEAAAARRAQAEALDVPMADPAFLQNRLLRTNLGIEQGANAIIDMAGGVADLAGHTFLGGSYLGAGAMTAAGGALAFILGDSQAAEVNVGRAQGFFADAGEHAYAIIEAYLGFCAGNIQHLITDPLGATMPMSPMVQMRRALSLSLGDFDAWANVTTEGLMALGGVVLGKTLSALGRIGRGVGVTVEAAPGASVASTSGSGATTPSPGSTPTPPLLLTTGNPTTLTLRQVRNLRGKSLWQGGEQYVQELYGSAGQQHFSVPAQGAGVSGGGRFVDAPVVGTNGVLGLEVKTYLRWRTVHGAPQRGAVPLSPEIQEQVLRDAWLQTHHPGGFDPRWVFIDAPPSQALADFLTAHNVAYIVYQ
ncbi:MAG: hypothetical protein KC766_37985, partial [Myxococcales bacterium]|nr:hypothetical protein [Myxococcales bacterium]